MDPATWTVIGVIALVSFIAGCDEDAGGGNDEDVQTDDGNSTWFDSISPYKDVKETPPEVREDVVVIPEEDIYVEDLGYNSRFMRFKKEIVDVDVEGNNVIALLKEPLEGEDYIQYARKDTEDAFSEVDPEMVNASARQIGISFQGDYKVIDIVPQQIIWAGTGVYESSFIIPFANKADDLGFCRSGISMTDPDGTYTSIVSPVTIQGLDPSNPATYTACNVTSATIVDKGEGKDPEIWMPATDASYGIGFLKACTLPGGYIYKLTQDTCSTPQVFIEENVSDQSAPSAIALLPYNMGVTDDPTLAVLDREGIRLVKANFTAGDISSEVSGYQDAYIDTIKTGTGDLPSLKEVPLTADGELAVIISGATLVKIKMKQRVVGGSLELTSPPIHHDEIGDLIVKGGKVYATYGHEVHIWNIHPNDHDANPTLYAQINAGGLAHSLDVDDNGIIYVVTEDKGSGEWNVTSIDPEIAMNN